MNVNIIELEAGDVIGFHLNPSLSRETKLRFLKSVSDEWNSPESLKQLNFMDVGTDITIFKFKRVNVDS